MTPHLSDAASPGSSFFSSLCSSSSPSCSSRWEVLVVVLVVRDSRVHTVSCNVTEKNNRTHGSHTTFLLPALRVWRLIWLARHILVNHILLRAAHLHTVGYKQHTQQQYHQDFSQRQGGQDLHVDAVMLPSNASGLLVSLAPCQLEGMRWIFPKPLLRCTISPNSLKADTQPSPPHVILLWAVISW